ncbi:hypothetical protein [Bacillus solitudinis]|uniref:hypothetical protein n=1 Tax=Bacillus solitudinis TaxID=2014074 RepID=UPI000C233B9C|nr:hypothetical protein [Bacillus solitudinis]
MYKSYSDTNDLYVVANVDENNNVISFPMGGGSSTKPSIKAHTNFISAKRSSKFFRNSKVVKVTSFEVIDE